MANTQVVESNLMPKFRTRLQELREARGWERQDLLREAIRKGHEITYGTIMMWENQDLSRIDANTTAVFMDVLKCKWYELFDMVDDNDEPEGDTAA